MTGIPDDTNKLSLLIIRKKVIKSDLWKSLQAADFSGH
jgi:hypothetical protein